MERSKARRQWLTNGDVTRVQLIEIYEKAQGKCSYCGESVRCGFTPFAPRGFDHVIAMTKGGKHAANNMVICCPDCNYRKGANSFYIPKVRKRETRTQNIPTSR